MVREERIWLIEWVSNHELLRKAKGLVLLSGGETVWAE